MKIENINSAIENAKKLINEDASLSSGAKAVFELLILIISVLMGRITKNSFNSSKPPSTDPNREKTPRTNKSGKKPGGQNGHEGTTLMPVENPDEIVTLKLKRKDLPKGEKLRDGGYEVRQVINLKITTSITEYRAQVMIGKNGKRYVANFPGYVTQPIQYGPSVKSHAVYMSQYQMIPYNRVHDYFKNELKCSISSGSFYNFNLEAYNLLKEAEAIIKEKLIHSDLLHADETGININGKKFWLHTTCNGKWVAFIPHAKRGTEAMNGMGIIPSFKGILCHDHWKSYYTYTNCLHSLCNAHHLRELQSIVDNNKHTWAQEMIDFLTETNKAVDEAGGVFDKEAAEKYRIRYREILARGDIESPPPVRDPNLKKRGKLKKEKHRNLLERLRDYEDDVLRFMETDYVPFTNNLGENDLRMTKVQQKISGCFRSFEGAQIFCRVRGYLLTCQKHGVTPTEALETLFSGKQLPDFFYQ